MCELFITDSYTFSAFGRATRAAKMGLRMAATLPKVPYDSVTPKGPSGPTLPAPGEDLSFLEATPYWDQTNVQVNIAKQKNPLIGKIVSVQRMVGPKAPGETCNIVIDHRGMNLTTCKLLCRMNQDVYVYVQASSHTGRDSRTVCSRRALTRRRTSRMVSASTPSPPPATVLNVQCALHGSMLINVWIKQVTTRPARPLPCASAAPLTPIRRLARRIRPRRACARTTSATLSPAMR